MRKRPRFDWLSFLADPMSWLHLVLGLAVFGAVAYAALYVHVMLLVWGTQHFAVSAGQVQ